MKVLKSCGIKTFYTKEPYQLKVKKAVRRLAKDYEKNKEKIFELFANDRKKHQKIILKKLKTHYVICDRYYYSTFAYQHISKRKILSSIKGLRKPEIVFILDLPVSEALKRIGKRGKKTSFEKYKILSEARKRFLNLKGKNIIVLDATRKPSEIVEKMIEKI